MKKLIYITIIILITSFAANREIYAQNRNANNTGEITVWSFTDEVETMIFNYYIKAFPNVKINYSQTSTEKFEERIDSALLSGRSVPDIITLESFFVRKYVESRQLLDITDIYERNKDKLLKYPVEVGTYEGRVYALSWNACPGAMFYRRSLAKQYLGSDEPEYVQSYFKDLDTFLKTAELLKSRSDGKCAVVPGYADIFNMFLGSRSTPWIVDGKLNIDPNMIKYMDIVKIMHDNRYDARVGQWSEHWFAGIRGEIRDENRKPIEVFSYFLPTWGLQYVLKINANETSGDWAMIQGPAAYRWGGTWIGAYKDTKNTEQVKQIIEYLTANDNFLEAWARDTGDIVSSFSVMDRIKDSIKDKTSVKILGGQNHYASFIQMAMNVNGKITQKTDQEIESLFLEEVTDYIQGNKTKVQALADFRAQAQTILRNQ